MVSKLSTRNHQQGRSPMRSTTTTTATTTNRGRSKSRREKGNGSPSRSPSPRRHPRSPSASPARHVNTKKKHNNNNVQGSFYNNFKKKERNRSRERSRERKKSTSFRMSSFVAESRDDYEDEYHDDSSGQLDRRHHPYNHGRRAKRHAYGKEIRAPSHRQPEKTAPEDIIQSPSKKITTTGEKSKSATQARDRSRSDSPAKLVAKSRDGALAQSVPRGPSRSNSPPKKEPAPRKQSRSRSPVKLPDPWPLDDTANTKMGKLDKKRHRSEKKMGRHSSSPKKKSGSANIKVDPQEKKDSDVDPHKEKKDSAEGMLKRWFSSKKDKNICPIAEDTNIPTDDQEASSFIVVKNGVDTAKEESASNQVNITSGQVDITKEGIDQVEVVRENQKGITGITVGDKKHRKLGFLSRSIFLRNGKKELSTSRKAGNNPDNTDSDNSSDEDVSQKKNQNQTIQQRDGQVLTAVASVDTKNYNSDQYVKTVINGESRLQTIEESSEPNISRDSSIEKLKDIEQLIKEESRLENEAAPDLETLTFKKTKDDGPTVITNAVNNPVVVQSLEPPPVEACRVASCGATSSSPDDNSPSYVEQSIDTSIIKKKRVLTGQSSRRCRHGEETSTNIISYDSGIVLSVVGSKSNNKNGSSPPISPDDLRSSIDNILLKRLCNTATNNMNCSNTAGACVTMICNGGAIVMDTVVDCILLGGEDAGQNGKTKTKRKNGSSKKKRRKFGQKEKEVSTSMKVLKGNLA